MSTVAASPTRPDLVVLAPHGAESDPLLAHIGAHPDIAVVGSSDFDGVEGDHETFPVNSFAPIWTEAPGCADAFESIAFAHRGAAHIAWRPGYGLEFPHVLAIIAESLPGAKVLAWLPDPVATTASRLARLLADGFTEAQDAMSAIDACLARMEDVARFDQRGGWDRYLADPDPLSLALQSGVYEPALERYRRVRGADRAHVIDPEDWPATARFCGVTSEPLECDAATVQAAPVPIDPAVRQRLDEFFMPFSTHA